MTRPNPSTPATAHTRRPRARAVLAVPLISAALLLGACGNTIGERAGTGAGIGAAGGAVVGALFGGIGVLPAALIGAGVGAGAGALTSQDQLDLGKPVWDR